MKRSVLKGILLLIIFTLCISLLVACDDTEEKEDKLKGINSTISCIDGIKSSEYTLKVMAGENEVYLENTAYTIDGDSVSTSTAIKKFNSDMWADSDYVTSEASGSIGLEELKGELHYGLKLVESDIVDFEEQVRGETVTYTFKLNDASLLLNLEQSSLTDSVQVEVVALNGKLNQLTIVYEYEGYSIESKYTINY